MQRLLYLILIAMLGACSSDGTNIYADPGHPYEDPEDYDPAVDNPPDPNTDFAWDGTTDKIYIEGNYGIEYGDNTKCSPPWSGGICAVPDYRTWSIGVHQYSCPNQLFKDQILDAANHIRDVLNANGWDIYQVKVYTTDPGNVDLAHVRDIFCGPNPGTAIGRTDCGESILQGWDCHDTANGDLCQFKDCVTKIDSAKIMAMQNWNAATNTQRGIVIENVGRHEFGHAAGLGHATQASGDLMKPATNAAGGTDWTTLKTYTTTEKHQFDCYKETSGTTPNC